MVKRVLGLLIVSLVLAAGLAWALSDGDTGVQWLQASSRQKIEVANILSRELGGDPGKYIQCLDKVFGDPKNAGMTIRDVAQQCKSQP
jgi:hypothetical protein